MDDLNGLDWSVAPNVVNRGPASKKQQTSSVQNLEKSILDSFSSPSYGKSAPKSSPVVSAKTIDSFSNLVSFGSSRESTLSLQEQQQKLDAEKQKQATKNQSQYNMQVCNSEFWENYGTKSLGQKHAIPTTYQNSMPEIESSFTRRRSISPPTVNGSAVVGHGADKDLFAAFNSETRVDVSSHYPPPATNLNKAGKIVNSITEKPLDLSKPHAWRTTEASADIVFGDDDDPFGLSEVKSSLFIPHVLAPHENELDLLGDLGKPVEELRRQETSTIETFPKIDLRDEEEALWEAAITELVQMGFSIEESRRALVESDSNLDIQAAVNWLINRNQAKTRIHKSRDKRSEKKEAGNVSTGKTLGNIYSPKMRNASIFESQRDSHESTEKIDILREKSPVGSNLLKTANSLWKTSQMKVHKVVSEFQQQDAVSDPSQPKWMRNNSVHRDLTRRLSIVGGCVGEQAKNKELPSDLGEPKWLRNNNVHRELTRRLSIVEGRAPELKSQYITDEALLLEGYSQTPEIKVRASDSKKTSPKSSQNHSPNISKMLQPVSNSESNRQNPLYHEQRSNDGSARPDSEYTYISPARRKKRSPLGTPSKYDTENPHTETSNSFGNTSITPKPVIPKPSKPKSPTRNLPHISPAMLQLSTQHRLAGTSHFKRGDFASAYTSYSSSLDALPPTHPINIVLLCNRALTSLKNGLPKSAILDSDQALYLIGESRGDGETIDLGPGQEGGSKEMKIFYGKALLRKAEALEQMERWKDAGEVWKKCVEQGVGGSAAAEGRTRCEKLLAPNPPSLELDGIPPRISARPNITRKISYGISTGDSAAIKRLREANEKAEIADNQKLELIDKVDARIGLWKDGKSDNLRALIGSLDMVLWEGSGWKNVGLHELIQNNKVKIHYMKAIGKTHPDKLPQDASTEVRMIAAQVFATLNESWDTFKRQNGM